MVGPFRPNMIGSNSPLSFLRPQPQGKLSVEYRFRANLLHNQFLARTSRSQRCQYGRVYHRLYATACSTSTFVSDLQDWCTVDLIVNPTRVGRDGEEDVGPIGLDVAVNGFEDEIGVSRLACS